MYSFIKQLYIIHYFLFATQAENFTFLNRHLVLSDKLCFFSSNFIRICCNSKAEKPLFSKRFSKVMDEFHLRANILFSSFYFHKKFFCLKIFLYLHPYFSFFISCFPLFYNYIHNVFWRTNQDSSLTD